MNANLLLFKTVVAGDSWGQIAVPVIQENPGTLVIFIGSLVTMVFGVLNVIVAVVVDTFADARQRDVQNLAEELDDDIVADKKDLQKIFNRIDVDGSGQLTMDELLEGARSDPAFQSRLRVMDIDENDLMQLFSMIDNDSSGTIEVAEFIGPLSRWAHDSKTAPRFIKYNLLQSINLQEDLYDMSQTHFHGLSHKIDDIQNQLHMLRLQMTQKVFEKEGSPGRKAEDMDGTRSIETTAMHTVSMELESSDSGIILPKTLAASEASKEPAFLSLEREFSRGDLEMPHASREVPLLEPSHMGQRMLEGKLEESMARIEGKLERLWQGLLLPSPGALGVRLVGPEDSFDSSRLNRRPSGASVGASPSPEMEAGHARRKVKPAWDMFQSMYMDKGVTRRRASLRKNDPKEKKKDEKRRPKKDSMRRSHRPKRHLQSHLWNIGLQHLHFGDAPNSIFLFQFKAARGPEQVQLEPVAEAFLVILVFQAVPRTCVQTIPQKHRMDPIGTLLWIRGSKLGYPKYEKTGGKLMCSPLKYGNKKGSNLGEGPIFYQESTIIIIHLCRPIYTVLPTILAILCHWTYLI